MSPKLRNNLILLFFLTILFIGLLRYKECDFKTYKYNEDVNKIREQIYSMDCYNDTRNDDLDFVQACVDLIKEHNSIVKEWNNLTCVEEKLDIELDEGPTIVEFDLSDGSQTIK
jgi:hypothetical protein